MARRVAFLIYGLIAYVLFFASFLYVIGFMMNLDSPLIPKTIIPKTIDSGELGPISTAIIVNVLLLSLFAIQHTIMARPAFKRWWTTIVPQPIERSTFVLFTALILFLLYWQWQPMPEIVWSVENAAGKAIIQGVYWLGWVIVLISTFLLGHFDLFGVNQVWCHFLGKEDPPAKFRTPLFYQYTRHPLMVGFIVAFWAGESMSQGRLLFCGVVTAYILIAIQIEERDLIGLFGDEYRDYKKRVSMLIPMPPRKAS